MATHTRPSQEFTSWGSGGRGVRSPAPTRPGFGVRSPHSQAAGQRGGSLPPSYRPPVPSDQGPRSGPRVVPATL